MKVKEEIGRKESTFKWDFGPEKPPEKSRGLSKQAEKTIKTRQAKHRNGEEEEEEVRPTLCLFGGEKTRIGNNKPNSTSIHVYTVNMRAWIVYI